MFARPAHPLIFALLVAALSTLLAGCSSSGNSNSNNNVGTRIQGLQLFAGMVGIKVAVAAQPGAGQAGTIKQTSVIETVLQTGIATLQQAAQTP